MSSLNLRDWQAEFLEALAAHDRDDFLLVACPAAGKTIAAGAAVAAAMERLEADQLIAVCPTVVIRDQWQAELGSLGFRMLNRLAGRSWPPWVHGACVTFAQIAYRAEDFAEACAQRRTVVIFDEIHHAGEQLAWGAGIGEAFSGAAFRLQLSGTPFRSDHKQIPFIRYDDAGGCVADFAYDYQRAVREGVCRPVEFRAHDGEVTWVDGDGEATARFTDKVLAAEQPRRLRASLDPGQPYLRDLLAAAHEDLLALRERIPDTAGLVVCDSQQHALEVDRLLNQLTGSVPTLAISDLPRAHQAIAAFAGESEPWLVSVRMVAEGVDIPRLGVVVWATTSSTELMVRQVAGRALRGRHEYPSLPAVVHMPADPRLVEYAERLDVLAGVSRRSHGERGRHGGTGGGSGSGQAGYRCLAATHDGASTVIRPPLPEPEVTTVAAVPDPLEVSTPELPRSPADVKAMTERREADRAELYRLLNVYMRLRRHSTPGFGLPAAQAELVAAVGAVGTEASDELLAEALDWIREQSAQLAIANPELVKSMARARRRAELGAAA